MNILSTEKCVRLLRFEWMYTCIWRMKDFERKQSVSHRKKNRPGYKENERRNREIEWNAFAVWRYVAIFTKLLTLNFRSRFIPCFGLCHSERSIATVSFSSKTVGCALSCVVHTTNKIVHPNSQCIPSRMIRRVRLFASTFFMCSCMNHSKCIDMILCAMAMGNTRKAFKQIMTFFFLFGSGKR